MKSGIMNESSFYSFFPQNSDWLNTEKSAIYLQTCYRKGLILTELLFLADLLLVLMTHGVEEYLGVSLQGT